MIRYCFVFLCASSVISVSLWWLLLDRIHHRGTEITGRLTQQPNPGSRGAKCL